MFRCGDSEAGFRREGVELGESIVVISYDALFYGVVEIIGPRRAVRGSEIDAGEVVHDVAAADDEHALLPERREGLGQRVMPRGGLAAVEAELHYGDLRLRIHRQEYAPRAVIEATGFVEVRATGEHGGDAAGKGRVARSWILDFVQGAGKTMEIVDGGWFR